MNPVHYVVVMVGAGIFVSLPGSAVRAEAKEHVREVDILHYAIAIAIDEKENRVDGTVAIRCVPLESVSAIHLDAGEMDIHGVTLQRQSLNPVALAFVLRAGTLTIQLPSTGTREDTLDVAIAYSCRPKAGMYFVHPDTAYPLRPVQVWTQGEEEQNHFWFPCYDHPDDKATVEMRVTVNDRYAAISNGALIEQTSDSIRHTKTFTWYSAKPCSSYLISLVVGSYEKLGGWYKNIPVDYYVYPTQKREAMRSFSPTTDMMAFYSTQIGFDYPWQKYAQTVVNAFAYSGMENVSAATLTDRTIHDSRAQLDYSSEGLIAHELAHQWFGDLLTCRSWTHAWLNEGFATYFGLLYVEHAKGRDAFRYGTWEMHQRVILSDTGSARRATVTDLFEEPSDVFDYHIYDRGASILHMLRFILGDDTFWQGVRHYVDLHQYGNVSTADLQSALEEVSGERLDWFFDEWVTKGGYPEYAVTASFDAPLKLLRLTVRQTQKIDALTPLYRMPVAVEITTATGPHIKRVLVVASTAQRIDIPVDGEPLNVVFDKGGWILKKLAFEKSAKELVYQLRHGDVTDRLGALDGLTPLIVQPDIRRAVADALTSDSFYGVRRAAARVLGESKVPAALGELAAALQDTDSGVRLAVAAGLQNFMGKDVVGLLQHLVQNDSSYSVIAQSITSLVHVDPGNAIRYCDQGLSMASYNDSIRAAAIKALGLLKTKEAHEKLVLLTRYGQSTHVRGAALDALADNWRADGSVRALIEGFVGDRALRIRRTALKDLGKIADPESRPVLQRVLATEGDEILRREARAALRAIDHTTAQQ